jgi:uncharacterized membrane protein (DUF2068 family)
VLSEALVTDRRSPGLLLAIAIFKLVKSCLLIALGVSALLLAHDGNSFASVRHAVSQLRLDPDNHYVHQALAKISGQSTRRLEELGVGTFVYAAVFLVEGTGLVLRKRWAEYLTTVVTASFVPFEIYELVHEPSALKVVGIVVNVAIVVYLIVRLRSERRDAGAKG